MAKAIQNQQFPMLGGIRTNIPVDDLNPQDAIIAKNCRLDVPGEVTRRKGGEKFNTTQYTGESEILGLFDFRYSTDSKKFITAENTVIYTDDGTTRTSIKTGQTADNYYDFSAFDDFCWISNGADRFLKYDGTTVTFGSIVEPSVGSFSATPVSGSGVADGTYKYLVTFYVTATGQESNPFTLANAVSATTASPNNQVDLANIPVSGDSQVTARRIYRTTAGGSEFNAQLVTTINDNVSTTYSDTTPDASLGALVPLNHDTAPVFKKTVVYKGRGFGITGGDSTLYYSVLNNFWYWPQGQIDTSVTADDFRELIDPDDGDFITNIVPYYDLLLIFKRNSVYVWGGYDQTDFFVRKIEYVDRVGCISSRGAVVADNWCYFIDRNGIYRTNAQVIEYIGDSVEAFFDPDNIASEEKVNPGMLENSVAIVDHRKPRNLIRFSMPSSNSDDNDLHLIYSYDSDLWSLDTGYKAQSYAIREIDNEDFLIRGDCCGWVWTEEQIDGDGGLISSTATSGTTTTLTDTTQNWTVDLYKGAFVEIVSGTAEGERYQVLSNTSDTITIDGTFSAAPDTTSAYLVGAIDFLYIHKWDNYGNAAMSKRLKYIRSRVDGSGDYNITAYIWYDFKQELTTTTIMDIDAQPLWDVALWDVDEWDNLIVSQDLIRSLPNRIHYWSAFGIGHKTPGQPVTFKGYDKYFQVKGYGFR